MDYTLETFCKILALKRAKYPQLRIGQLIGNALEETDLYSVEDGTLVKKLAAYNPEK